MRRNLDEGPTLGGLQCDNSMFNQLVEIKALEIKLGKYIKTSTFTMMYNGSVVYSNQHLGVVQYKRWLKSSF